MNKEWVCFKDEFPKSECGLVIKIDSDKDQGYGNLKGRLYYGYVFSNGYYIYITHDLRDLCGMGWKVHKDYDLEDLYWLHDSVFEKDNK